MAAKRLDIWHEGGGIGRWELKLDNTGSPGASEYLSPNLVASVLGINGMNLMAGYVDDVKPDVKDESAVFSKYVKVLGRNYGRDLANLFIIKKYAATKFDDLVDDALSVAGSEITYTSPHTGPLVDADFNKTFLQTGFVEAANLIAYDFKVDNTKALTLWALASAPSSGVLLKAVAGDAANNILLIDPKTVAGVDIRNYVRVDAGTLNDHWTEGNAGDWVGYGCTLADETNPALVASGAACIKVTAAGTNSDPIKVELTSSQYNNPVLDYTKIGTSDNYIWILDVDIPAYYPQIYVVDDAGHTIGCYIKLGADEYGTYQKIPFSLGADVPFGNDIGQWHYIVGSSGFTWRITKIGVILSTGGPHYADTICYIDGLKLDGIPVWALAEDVAGSQTTYGKRMVPFTHTDIKSQVQLQAVADNECLNRKNPINKLTLTCMLQTSLLYAGYLVDVLAPDAYIGSGSTPVIYRILTIHHTAEPGADLCKGHDAITVLELIKHDGGVGADPTRFKLASSPQAAINVRYDTRIRVLEGSLTGSGSVLGGGGGGVDWGNVPYLNVLGDADFLSNLTANAMFVVKNTQTNDYINIHNALVYDPDYPTVFNPILHISQGIWGMKDISIGGFLGSASPCRISFGSTYTACVLSDIGKPVFDDGVKIGALAKYDNTLKTWWITHVTGQHVQNGSVMTIPYGAGHGTTNAISIYGGGGAIILGHGFFTADVDNPYIYLCDGPAGFDTLELRSFEGFADFECRAVYFNSSLSGDEDVYLYKNTVGAFNVLELAGDGMIIDGFANISAIMLTVAQGTAPIGTISTTKCENLNADLLDGHHIADLLGIDEYGYVTINGIHFGSGWGDIYRNTVAGNKIIEISGVGVIIDEFLNVVSISATGQVGVSIAQGTSPFSIVSTTVNANLNADLLDGNHSSAFLGVSATATDSDKLDGVHASGFLLNPITGSAAIAWSSPTDPFRAIDFYNYRSIWGTNTYDISIQTANAANNGYVERVLIKGHAAQNSAGIDIYETLNCKNIIPLAAETYSIGNGDYPLLGVVSKYIYGEAYRAIDLGQFKVLAISMSMLSTDVTSPEVFIGGAESSGNCLVIGFNRNENRGYIQVYGDDPQSNIAILTGRVASVYTLYYHTHTPYDSLDDVALLKNYKLTKNEVGEDVIDIESLPFLKGTHPDLKLDEVCWDLGKVTGFMFGALKQHILKTEEQLNAIAERLIKLENPKS